MFPWTDYRLWLAAGAAAFLTGAAKSGIPGLGILSVPLMALVLPAKISVGTLLPLLIAADLIALRLHHQHARGRQIAALMPWVAVGMYAAYLALGRLDDATVKPLLGALVLGMILLEGVRRQMAWDRLPHHPAFVAATGVLGGFATTMGNAAGPIMNIYLLARGLTKEAFVGTAAWYFFIVNVVKVPLFVHRKMITRESVLFDLALLPLVGVGAWLGYGFVSRVSPRGFQWVVFGLAALAAMKLIW